MTTGHKPSAFKTARLTLSTAGQTREKLIEIVSAVLGHANCLGCGRMIAIDVHFGGDPGPDLTHLGVNSFETQ